MTKHRANRLAEAIKMEISQMIREDLKDPRIGFVTVTGVDVADDLGHAKVYVSILGNEEVKKASFAALKSAQGHVRTELGKRIRLRHVPEIVFKDDPSIEHGAHISKLLHEVGVVDQRNSEDEDHDN